MESPPAKPCIDELDEVLKKFKLRFRSKPDVIAVNGKSTAPFVKSTEVVERVRLRSLGVESGTGVGVGVGLVEGVPCGVGVGNGVPDGGAAMDSAS